MEEPLIIKLNMTDNYPHLEFKAGSLNLNVYPSFILNNPLEELYNSMKRLLEHKTGEVTWWLEPHTYFFYFERTGTKDFRLTISEAPHIDKEREQLTVLNGSYKQLIAPIRKALLEFCELDYDKKHWPVSFNKANLEKLPKGL